MKTRTHLPAPLHIRNLLLLFAVALPMATLPAQTNSQNTGQTLEIEKTPNKNEDEKIAKDLEKEEPPKPRLAVTSESWFRLSHVATATP